MFKLKLIDALNSKDEEEIFLNSLAIPSGSLLWECVAEAAVELNSTKIFSAILVMKPFDFVQGISGIELNSKELFAIITNNFPASWVWFKALLLTFKLSPNSELLNFVTYYDSKEDTTGLYKNFLNNIDFEDYTFEEATILRALILKKDFI